MTRLIKKNYKVDYGSYIDYLIIGSDHIFMLLLTLK